MFCCPCGLRRLMCHSCHTRTLIPCVTKVIVSSGASPADSLYDESIRGLIRQRVLSHHDWLSRRRRGLGRGCWRDCDGWHARQEQAVGNRTGLALLGFARFPDDCGWTTRTPGEAVNLEATRRGGGIRRGAWGSGGCEESRGAWKRAVSKRFQSEAGRPGRRRIDATAEQSGEQAHRTLPNG
jgi:hypothetical protein